MITLVTSFFDIGRGDWKPHYLERKSDTYIERFTNLCHLQNDLIVYTTPDVAPRLRKIREELGFGDRTHVIEIDFANEFVARRARIRAVMGSPQFKALINPVEITNPEYWAENYVLVTSLKAYFVNDAIERGLVRDDMVSWIDFGYFRSRADMNGVVAWDHPFEQTKVHMFTRKNPTLVDTDKQVINAVTNNDVYIWGAMIVGHQKYWPNLAKTMWENLDGLMDVNLVDDDQGLLLMLYFRSPDLFALHQVADPLKIFSSHGHA